jgi:hypothetical protein
VTDCTDYHYYMNLTLAQKLAHFEEYYCGPKGLVASAALVRKLEALADANRNGVLSCEEFNGAYSTNITTTVDRFCTVNTNVINNFTTAPATAPASGPSSRTSSGAMGTATFQTLLVTVFATCIASLLA